MLHLNFSNAEEIVFYDRQLQQRLPAHMFGIFEQWRLAQRVPFLRDLGKQAILDFLNGIEDDEISIIEKHLNQKIIVERLNYSVALNLVVPLADTEICRKLCEVEGFNNYSLWRDDTSLYISFWR